MAQKRLRREKRSRKRLQDKLDLEAQRRSHLEEALKSAGSSDQIALINEKLAQLEQQQQQQNQQHNQQQNQQQSHSQAQKPSPVSQNMSAPTSTANTITTVQQQPLAVPGPPPPPSPAAIGDHRLVERPERIKQDLQDDPHPQYGHPPIREIREPPPPPDTKPWGYSGMDIMNTGAAFWQNYSESLAQELEMERKSRQQHVEREVKSPLQDRSAYYKNSVLFTSSAT